MAYSGSAQDQGTYYPTIRPISSGIDPSILQDEEAESRIENGLPESGEESAELEYEPYEFEEEGEGIELKTEFGEGFVLVSEDEEFELKIRILNQVDYKMFSPKDQEPSAIDGVYIPRMRVYFEGKLTDPFRYEISLQRSVEGQFDLLDANLDIAFSEAFQIRFGRTLIPYSYTWYDHLEQYFITPERPLFPLNFGLSRAAGIQVWGNDELRRWQYSIGVFDGRTAGLADNSTITDFVSYINFRPFVASNPGGLLENLNVGGSLVIGKFRRPSETLPLRTSLQSSENDEAADAASSTFLKFEDEAVGLGDRLIGAVHAAIYRNTVSLETEWNAFQQEIFNEATDETTDVVSNGFHITLASFITGEQIRGREEVLPLRPFDPRCGGIGAVEPFIRFSYLYIGDEVFDRGLVDETEWTNKVAMTDVGVNWYMNRWVKFYFDWQHSGFGSPVLVNEENDQFSIDNDLFWIRCQVFF